MILVDMATSNMYGEWMKNKWPEIIVKKVLERWIGIFNASSQLLTYNR